MRKKTREERLFGAACLRVTVERGGAGTSGAPMSVASAGGEIYRATLEDLGLTEEEVDEYLRQHRDEVERALSVNKRR